jgi:hypothetical protein
MGTTRGQGIQLSGAMLLATEQRSRKVYQTRCLAGVKRAALDCRPNQWLGRAQRRKLIALLFVLFTRVTGG